MTSTFQYDADASVRLIATYTTPDVVAQRQQVLQALHFISKDFKEDKPCSNATLAIS